MSLAAAPIDPRALVVARSAADRLLARRSLAAFTRRMFRGYTPGRHLDLLIDAVERAVAAPAGRLIVTMPPRHSKSLHVSEHLPAWYLGAFPDNRVIGAANTASLAYTFSRRVRNKLADPLWPFPGVRVAEDKGAVQAWDLDGHRGGYLAVGVGGTPTGQGADLLVVDDPIRSAADADSQTVRDALWEWYQGTIRTRLEPAASIVLTATRWHEDDLTGRLLAAESAGGEPWEHLHLPALSDDGDPLWPERWPLPELERARIAVGARTWEAQYQGRPSPAEGAVLKRDWWGWYDRAAPPHFSVTIQSADTAFKTGTANDWSVVLTWGLAPDGYYLIDRWRERVAFPDLKRAAVAAYDRWRPEAVYVEDAASGQSLVQELQSATRLPVIPVRPDRDKLARVHAVSPTVEAGKVKLPRGAAWADEFVEEAAAFPHGAHDDQVDAFTLGLAQLIGRAEVTEADAAFARRHFGGRR